jgi:hypothetical protein
MSGQKPYALVGYYGMAMIDVPRVFYTGDIIYIYYADKMLFMLCAS